MNNSYARHLPGITNYSPPTAALTRRSHRMAIRRQRGSSNGCTYIERALQSRFFVRTSYEHVEMRKKGRNCASRNATARGDAQKGPKLRIQKCCSTRRCAKRGNNAHPAVRGQGQEAGLKHDEWGQKADSVQKKRSGSNNTLGPSKNRSYLLSHLVGQYHRRW